MEIKDLTLLDNSVVGKYIEVNLNEYELKLVSSNTVKNVEDHVRSNNAEAGINGGLFNSKDEYVIGKLKDSNGTIKGDGSSEVPYILFRNNELTMDWNLSDNQLKGYNFARTCAYYAFLLNGEYGEHTLIPNHSEGINTSKKRSMIGQKYNGNIILAVSTSNLTGRQQAEALKKIGCHIGINLDGGGSVQMYNNNSYVYKSWIDPRKITDAIVVIKKQTTPTFTGYYLNTFLQPVRIRESVVNGREKILVPRGKQVRIIRFIPSFQSDGYQWCESEYNGVRGFSQVDTLRCYTISGPNNRLRILTTNGQLRVRETPVNGNVKVTVPRGSSLLVESLIPGIQSDGYQWAFVNYNGTKGYSQIDTKNWNTLSM